MIEVARNIGQITIEEQGPSVLERVLDVICWVVIWTYYHSFVYEDLYLILT